MADSDDSVIVPEVVDAIDIEVHFVDADALLGTSEKVLSAGGRRVPGAPHAILAKNAAVEAYEVEVDELLGASYDASRPVCLPDWVETEEFPVLSDGSASRDESEGD